MFGKIIFRTALHAIGGLLAIGYAAVLPLTSPDDTFLPTRLAIFPPWWSESETFEAIVTAGGMVIDFGPTAWTVFYVPVASGANGTAAPLGMFASIKFPGTFACAGEAT